MANFWRGHRIQVVIWNKSRFSTTYCFISETIQGRAIVTTEDEFMGTRSYAICGLVPLPSYNGRWVHGYAFVCYLWTGATSKLQRKMSSWVRVRMLSVDWYHFQSSSRMRVMNHNWSATKQRLHPQSVAEISRHSVLSWDRIRQCGTSSVSRHKDTDQCL